jgi:hypothetical protein
VSDIDPDALVGSWTHVREQDSDDLVAFCPSDSPIPPARGRTAMDLVAGGDLRQFAVGADDRRVVSAGSWRLDGRELTLHTGGGTEERYEVESVTDKQLVLRKGRSADIPSERGHHGSE